MPSKNLNENKLKKKQKKNVKKNLNEKTEKTLLMLTVLVSK